MLFCLGDILIVKLHFIWWHLVRFRMIMASLVFSKKCQWVVMWVNEWNNSFMSNNWAFVLFQAKWVMWLHCFPFLPKLLYDAHTSQIFQPKWITWCNNVIVLLKHRICFEIWKFSTFIWYYCDLIIQFGSHRVLNLEWPFWISGS